MNVTVNPAIVIVVVIIITFHEKLFLGISALVMETPNFFYAWLTLPSPETVVVDLRRVSVRGRF